MLSRFREHIQVNFPELLDQKFLLACSGGMDSTVLLWLCHSLNMDFAIAHCNFGLRGAESDEDAVWVKELAKKINREVFVKNFDTDSYIKINKVSVQIAARELRYTWFAEIQKENDLPFCITAHHADDNLETFLINLSRGTGIKGLMGIPEKTANVARPLLVFSQDEIADYALEQRLQWREDSSNREFKYLRNQIRHRVLPRIKETHPSFMQNFARTQSHLRESQAMLQNHLQEIRKEAFTEEEGVIRISLEALEGLNPLRAYLHGLLSDYGFREWDDIELLLQSNSGKVLYSNNYRIVKDRNDLLLQELEPTDSKVYQYPFTTGDIEDPVALKIEEVDNLGELSESILYLDKETLKHSLTLRKWKKGDYFYPFGMAGKRKLLSKYFKDEKMDLIAKENQWLLCIDNEIAWVVGRRSDERFRVTEKTKKIIKITYLG
ncbi:tRNA lysidine(34) synthetase TilS [Lentiprolixibacter aurantiacus]|uniref:tRNA(Ile)-lysidine synthase n=1 Tax=Lentiprolixibacter aurantiacus TaxID=2993939 RepID=A0AAE3MLP3_9FLAO|nr:tRNA lysidine(34) synthetase TilS [Lentiprolixibacter aurantiacus]MCX2719733.1 tRNA lysidine(34) synthetase TilS [Lentiprolixibacter aurantiacus]